MFWCRPGDDLPWEFAICHPANGQVVNADSTPVCRLSRNGVWDEDVEVTITHEGTGLYVAFCIVPSDYEPGDTIALRGYATIAGLPCLDILLQLRLVGVDFTQLAGVSIVTGTTSSRVANAGEILDGDPIVAYHYAPLEGVIISVFDGNDEPLDMSSYADDLSFVLFEMRLNREVKVAELWGDNVVLNEDHPHQVTLLNTTALNQCLGNFRWALRRRTPGNKVLRAQGSYTVEPCLDSTDSE